MSFVRVPNCGSVGVIKDLSQSELPVNAWTDAQNIRFLDGYAYQFYGHGEVYNSPVVVPYHVLPVKVGSIQYWLYLGTQKTYAVTNTGGVAVHTNLTRQTNGVDVDYAGDANTWTSTLLSGVPIINDGSGSNYPQYWDQNITHKFVDLTAWPANTYCKSIRSFKNYLIALNVTKSGTNYAYMVKWSHPADPGTLPISWDITDPTKDAGETDLAEGYDQIIDGLQLRDSFIIYKESSVWRMDYTGGAFVFKFQKVLGMSGAMNRNCIVEVDGFHLVLTNQDVVVHDGVQGTSVLDKQSRRFMFQDMDSVNSGNAFVFKNPFMNEVFVCYPSIGKTYCDKAMVWNYKDKTVSFRSIPNLLHANFGQVDNSLAGDWAQDSAPWGSDLSKWDGFDFVPSSARVIMGSKDQKLYLMDSSASFDGVIPQAYLERRGLTFDASEMIKLVRSVRLRISGNTGETVILKVGHSDDPFLDPTWDSTMTHIIGSTVSDDCLVTGRYISIRLETGTAYQWRLDGYDIDVESVGMW
jgi:hypothetical protein